jgi:aspartyl-tRNA(Asn)/glutamyl-tRNA(Gln) amidotransferase subunit A
MSANDVIAIQRARQRLIPQLDRFLNGALLAMPTCPITAPEIAPLEASDELFHQTNVLTVRNTMCGNFLDLCAVALPNGHDAIGLPTSFLLSAPNGWDEKLLAAASEVERLTGVAEA